MTDTELLDSLDAFKGQVRLSNKGASGYWWCYLTLTTGDDLVAKQGNSLRDVIEKVFEDFPGLRQLDSSPPKQWDDDGSVYPPDRD